MTAADLKKIDEELDALTALHKPEMSVDYMTQSGKKLINDDKNTNDVTLFTEEKAGKVLDFMRNVLHLNPFVKG